VNTYIITATAGAGGSITPAGSANINHGDDAAFTITPGAGYHILDVLVDGSSVGNQGTYTFPAVTSNHSISATFAVNTYIITATAGAGGSITPSGSVGVNHGEDAAFSISSDEGYEVQDVLVDGASEGVVSAYTFPTVTSDHTIEVAFAQTQSSIEVTSPNGGERWKVGSDQTIAWTGTRVENVKIEYTADNGANWHTIIDSTPASSGSYTWTLPQSFNGDHNIYKIRVSDASDPAVNDWSDSTFTIFESVITWQGEISSTWGHAGN